MIKFDFWVTDILEKFFLIIFLFLMISCSIGPAYQKKELNNYQVKAIKCINYEELCPLVEKNLKDKLTLDGVGEPKYLLDISIETKKSAAIYENKDDITRYLVRFLVQINIYNMDNKLLVNKTYKLTSGLSLIHI